VTKASATVTTALWQGALLVAIVVFIFLGGWRPSLVVVLSIPFSVGFAFIAMHILGIGANLMSLGGVAIAIGMMVDGAIVITENVDRGLRETEAGLDNREIVARSSAEVIAPRVEGKTFRPLAASAALAMTGSLFYAALIAPAMANALMRRSPKPKAKRPDVLAKYVSKASSLFVKRRFSAILLAGVLLLAGGLGGSRLGSEFTPALEEGDILLRITMAPSISLTEASATTTRIEKRLLTAFPEIKSIVTRIGRGEVGAHADPTNSAEGFVELKPKTQWRPGMTAEDLRTEISENLESYPGIVVNELAVKIFGPDSEVLLEQSKVLQSLLQQVDGAAEVQADQITGAPQLVVTVDRAALGRYGLARACRWTVLPKLKPLSDRAKSRVKMVSALSPCSQMCGIVILAPSFKTRRP